MNIIKLIVTFFGAGLVKKAQGTAGTFAAFLISLTFMNSYYFPYICLVISILSLFVGIILTEIYIKNLQNKDPKEVVIDEVCGYFTACALTFVYIGKANLLLLTLVFAVFRLIDIVKPFPVSLIDKKMKNGAGVMMDDYIAGGIAALLVCGMFDFVF